ncbi:MAG TPA: inositol monophosphatase family protein [Acidimicrobiales bacterium]|nr:inositol monophosphatase family protein [Acidimicrobiales bacterium]
MPRPNPDELLELALTVACDAAALLRERRLAARSEVTTKSSSTDMVSDVDRDAERLVVEALLEARPDDGILGEEGAEQTGTSGVRWVVDPLDGTTNYLYGLPVFAVSVAAELDGSAVVGVVVDPSQGETFAAVRGAGATLDGTPIHANDIDDLAQALVGTGFAYDPRRRGLQAAVLAPVLPAVRDIRRSGAAAVDLCWVACGRLDAFYEKGLAPWDHAAGALIASEAGAVTDDLHGGPVSGDFAFASAPGISDPLRALLTRAGAFEA